MTTLSLCLIVKNEESILERALQSVALIADEIILVDTGSTDRTVEIARKFTDKIQHFKWIDDFSAARNYADTFATCDYIMFWDADCILRPTGLQNLLELKKKNFQNANLVSLKWILDKDEQGQDQVSVMRDMIYKRDQFHWEYPIHNRLTANSGTNVKALSQPSIILDHEKDPRIKSHRPAQTLKILKAYLFKHPTDCYLLFLLGEGAMQLQDYAVAANALQDFLDNVNLQPAEKSKIPAAIEKLCTCLLQLDMQEKARQVLEKYESNYANDYRFVLIYADITALSDISKAIRIYEKYLNLKKPNEQQLLMINKERFDVHPHLMLGKLYLLEQNKGKAIRHFRVASQLTLSQKTKAELDYLLQSI